MIVWWSFVGLFFFLPLLFPHANMIVTWICCFFFWFILFFFHSQTDCAAFMGLGLSSWGRYPNRLTTGQVHTHNTHTHIWEAIFRALRRILFFFYSCSINQTITMVLISLNLSVLIAIVPKVEVILKAGYKWQSWSDKGTIMVRCRGFHQSFVWTVKRTQ